MTAGSRTTGSTWLSAIIVLATAGIVAGLLYFTAALIRGGDWSAADLGILLPHVLVYAAVAGILLLGHRNDPRALYLGTLFLLIAYSFSRRFFLLPDPEPAAFWSTIGSLFATLRLQAFMPAAMWLFVGSFPRAASYGASARLARWGTRLSLVTGAFLLLVGLAPLAEPFGLQSSGGALYEWFALADGLFWVIVFGLLVAALPVAVWRARRARVDERRRVGLFIAGIVVGLSPVVIEVLLEALIPPYARFVRQPSVSFALGLVLYPLLLSIPLTTSYSVLVEHVLDVRLVVRKAVRYSLATRTVLAASIVPIVGLLAYAYDRRQEPLVEILSGPTPAVLVAAAAGGLALLRWRAPLLARIDRHFFREQYNSRRILADLVESARSAADVAALGSLFCEEIDRALHVDSIDAFVRSPHDEVLDSSVGGFRPLPLRSALARAAADTTRPLELDLDHPDDELATLGPEDWVWLAEGAFCLLVPMIGSDGRLLGIIGLGERRSELPYSREDRLFLEAVASSGALSLENRLLRDSSGRPGSITAGDELDGSAGVPAGGGVDQAAECISCGTVFAADGSPCPECEGATAPALVPLVLFDKFRFERRIGAGGMGVVYRASDLTLDRTVAIKTLPASSPAQSIRIRREARAMAAVSHANLAMIYGAETWRGTPMLIMEYLPGGTLARRLRAGPMPVDEVVRLGIAMCDVLDRIHGSGILHRDIKPSNIGIGSDGQPKLLDFGVASVLTAAKPTTGVRDARMLDASSLETAPAVAPSASSSAADGFAGTPIYLSPEAVEGAAADPSQDLWALCLVLYEALTGSNPMIGADMGETIDRILRHDPPAVRDKRPDCPAALSKLLGTALAKDRSRRPESAVRLRQGLTEVEAAFG